MMAGKNWRAGGKGFDSGAGPRVSARHRRVVRLALAAPAVSSGFAPSSYVGEFDPGMIWEDPDLAASWSILPGLGRAVDTDDVAPAQAFAAPAQCFRQLRPEQSQHGVVMTDAHQRIIFLQRPLPPNLRPGAFGYSA